MIVLQILEMGKTELREVWPRSSHIVFLFLGHLNQIHVDPDTDFA